MKGADTSKQPALPVISKLAYFKWFGGLVWLLPPSNSSEAEQLGLVGRFLWALCPVSQWSTSGQEGWPLQDLCPMPSQPACSRTMWPGPGLSLVLVIQCMLLDRMPWSFPAVPRHVGQVEKEQPPPPSLWRFEIEDWSISPGLSSPSLLSRASISPSLKGARPAGLHPVTQMDHSRSHQVLSQGQRVL